MPMPTLPSERNLLFAVLALQNDLAKPDDVLAAMQAWVAAKHRPLGELLVERGALDSEHRRLLDALIEAHVANRIGICPVGPSPGCQQGSECLPLSDDVATSAAAVPWPTLAQLKRDHIQRALERTGHNQRRQPICWAFTANSCSAKSRSSASTPLPAVPDGRRSFPSPRLYRAMFYGSVSQIRRICCRRRSMVRRP